MNALELKSAMETTGFLQYVVKAGMGGMIAQNRQIVFRFPNGYGASVIQGFGTYGNAELAVIKFNSDDNEDYTLQYDTGITDDVVGMETPIEMLDLLAKIKNLRG